MWQLRRIARDTLGFKKCGWDGRGVLQKENSVSLVFPKVRGTVESEAGF